MKSKRKFKFVLKRKLDFICAVMLILFAGMGLCLVGNHQSMFPVVFGWSWAYLISALFPLVVLIPLQLFILFSPNEIIFFIPSRLPAQGVMTGVLIAAGTAYASKLTGYHTRIFFLFQWILSLLILGKLWSKQPNLLFSYFVVCLFGILLFSFELPTLKERTLGNSKFAYWGDRQVFDYIFPTTPPLFNPGGRLRASAHVRMAVPPWDGTSVFFTTNAQGFRNKEDAPLAPPANEFRILSLGDSFATGSGVDDDSFYGALLEKRLNETPSFGKVRVLNAEVSDPARGLFYLQEHGLSFFPRMVLYGFCSNDSVQNYLSMAGPDPFFVLNDGKVTTRPQSAAAFSNGNILKIWETYAYPIEAHVVSNPFAKIQRIFFIHDLRSFNLIRYFSKIIIPSPRTEGIVASDYAFLSTQDHHMKFFDGALNLGFFYRKELSPAEAMYRSLFKTLETTNRMCREKRIHFVFVYFPQNIQTQVRDWQAFQQQWSLSPDDFDLMQQNKILAQYCQKAGISYIDLTTPFREAAPKYDNLYLRDGHFNADGHRVAASAVADFLINEK